jgi:outer membrane receptor protein involved in Fe transport
VGYTYHLDDETSLYTTVASGFRSPDLDERYQNTVMKFFTQEVTVEGNPNSTRSAR